MPAGIPVPTIVPMPDVSPETVALTLGFPVVLKARVGSSGDQVRIVHDLPALNREVTSWGSTRSGTSTSSTSTVRSTTTPWPSEQAGIEQEPTYRVSAWRQPTGSASQVETVSDIQLAVLGRRALEIVGCTGLVNIDVIRDRHGGDWVIDFNARAFGGAASFLCAGLDISKGYLSAIGQTRSPPARGAHPQNSRSGSSRPAWERSWPSGSITRAAVAFWRESKRYLRWLSMRYWLVEALVTIAVAGAARKTRSS